MAAGRVVQRLVIVFILGVVTTSCLTFEDPREVVLAAKVPSSFHEVAAIDDAEGEGRWALFSDEHDCVLLVVTVADRREVSAKRCPSKPFDEIVAAHDGSVTFNDRKRHRDCDGDRSCAALPTDVRLHGGVVYGQFGPMVKVVCAASLGEPLILRSSDDKYILAPLPVDRSPGGDLIRFLADGRLVGPDPPRVPPAEVGSCRDAAGLPNPTQPAYDWTLSASVPKSLREGDEKLYVGTDTGYDAGSIKTDLLANGGELRVSLHTDSTAIRVALAGTGHATTTQTVALPKAVTDRLREGTICPEATLKVDLTDDRSGPPTLTGRCE